MQINNVSFKAVRYDDMFLPQQNKIADAVAQKFDSYCTDTVDKLEELNTDILVKSNEKNVSVELQQLTDDFIPKGPDGKTLKITIANGTKNKALQHKLDSFYKKIQDFIDNPFNKYNEEIIDKKYSNSDVEGK